MRRDTRIGEERTRIRRITYAAMFLGLAMVLPFLTGQIPQIGAALSPMHIPVLLCGFLCGWPWGLAVGAIAPLLRGAVFGVPALMPTGVAMSFELAVYGAVSGMLYRALPRKPASVYAALIVSMIAGRIVWGIARYVISGLQGTGFTFKAFLAGAVINAVPGIILHIALIPVLVMVMERAGLSLNHPRQTQHGRETGPRSSGCVNPAKDV